MNAPIESHPADELPEFESALKELEELVEKLEDGELSLTDSLSCFERGVALSKHCHRMLEQARHTVTVLSDPDDASSEQPFPSAQKTPEEPAQ
ncbi:MAG: exodeoxyribonuclease VII small subunit [Wenzhouxiangella sp.]|jgi:exodeoxyribonuclease VII small subunit|nr:exodeoxyribonuclease VII small subunit [Wenzhouxiangella sp.]